MNFFGKIASVVVGILASVGLVSAPIQMPLASNLPQAPALVDTYLASNIGTTDTSMTLAKGTTNDGAPLSGYYCFTIDVNSPQLEYVCGTASGTAVTSMLRGIGFSNPNTTSSALAFTHRRFASVQSTDYPTLQLIVRQLTGVDTITSGSVLKYDPGITNAQINASNQNLATVGFVASTTMSGGVPATTANAGIVKLATSTDLANGNTTTTYGLVADSRFFSSSSVTSTNYQVPVAVNGILKSGFLPTDALSFSNTRLTSTTFSSTSTFGSSTIFNGSVTFASVPSSVLASSTTLSSGNGTYASGCVGAASSTNVYNTSFVPHTIFISFAINHRCGGSPNFGTAGLAVFNGTTVSFTNYAYTDQSSAGSFAGLVSSITTANPTETGAITISVSTTTASSYTIQVTAATSTNESVSYSTWALQ